MRKLAIICRRLERTVGGAWCVVKHRVPSGVVFSVHFQLGDSPSYCIGEDNVRDFRTVKDTERFLLDQFLEED